MSLLLALTNVAAGSISGTASITFGQSGAITGAGALNGTATVTFAQTGAIAASGQLAGSTTVVFGQSGTLQAQGALSALNGFTFGQSGSVTGAGALAGTSAIVFGQTGAALGSGALSGTATVTFGQSGNLTNLASGAMSGTAAIIFGQSGTLDQSQTQIITGGSDYSGFFKSGKRKKEDEPTERKLREVVKIGKAPNEVITGLVIPKAAKAQTRPSALDAINKSSFDAAKIKRDKLRAIQLADDEWLMMN